MAQYPERLKGGSDYERYLRYMREYMRCRRKRRPNPTSKRCGLCRVAGHNYRTCPWNPTRL